ncbi:unnamed protein product [Larinioides sclopetarius]|uniref:Secreted protein n=1 Tax=Larinioides sclopetarius TaxID=280406 RepID=A0AAV2B5W5_9ARAC
MPYCLWKTTWRNLLQRATAFFVSTILIGLRNIFEGMLSRTPFVTELEKRLFKDHNFKRDYSQTSSMLADITRESESSPTLPFYNGVRMCEAYRSTCIVKPQLVDDTRCVNSIGSLNMAKMTVREQLPCSSIPIF